MQQHQARPTSIFATFTAYGNPLLLTLLILLASCKEAETPPPPVQPIGGIKLTMAVVLEPAAEKIWDSAGFIVTDSEVQSLAPTTDEGWEEVRHGAAVVAETGNLLLMPGRRMPGDDWMEIAARLTQAGKRAMAAAEARDPDALFEVGGEIYNVCVSCHQLYWLEGASRVTESSAPSSAKPPMKR